MNVIVITIITAGVIVLLSVGLLYVIRKLWKVGDIAPLTRLKCRGWAEMKWHPLAWARIRAGLATFAELSVIGAWALWIGRPYLNSDSNFWPKGGEFMVSTQAHYGWSLLKECGACFFWNGFSNGGAPAFADLHSAWLHPLVALLTLLFGVVHGAALATIGGFWMAGIAQWWLAKVLRLGLLPRIWSACLVVAGGHLAGRMENGLVPLVLSTAACSLVIPSALDLALHGQRRAAIGLSITLALAIVAGQGYLQLGLLFSLFPALLVLFINNRLRLRAVWKEFVLAGVLALMLAAFFLVPLAHFGANLAKDTDSAFQSAQSLAYTPLNLVIADRGFYYLDGVLGKQPYPYLYTSYIGWIPVLLAMFALRFVPRNKQRQLAFLLIALVLVYCFSSATTLKALVGVLPTTWVRNPAPASGLAVPFILALAAWSLNEMLKLDWPRLSLVSSQSSEGGYVFGINTVWLVLAVPLLWSLYATANFSSQWVSLTEQPKEVDQVISRLTPSTAQWVQPPWGENFWAAASMDAHLKIAYLFRPWRWEGRKMPPPFAEGIRSQETEINIVMHPENEYAFVETPTATIPCEARAKGGDIDVTCQTDALGKLVVRENQWSGWYVTRDDQSAELGTEPWLTTAAPPGQHHYAFRYRPWDVPLGIVLSLLGVVFTIILWFRRSVAASEISTPDF